jgi:RNA polymerase sigma factor (sigma-70 family)
MDQTRSTLLVRLRDLTDRQAWATFDRLYRPMIVGYARARGLPQADADDVGQQCAQAVLEQIGGYAHAGSFRAWLRSIAEHKIADLFRRRREVPIGSSPPGARETAAGPDPAQLWDRHWDQAHLRFCAEAVRHEVADDTYAAFVGYALDGRPAAAVAASLGMTTNQVYVSKHRVLQRLRDMMLELTGEEPSGLAP